VRKAIEIARREIGYKANGSESKYFSELFPGKRAMPWCVPFIEWVFQRAYGKQRALKMLYMQDGKFISSVTSFMNLVKQNNKWHFKRAEPFWLVFLAQENEWTNHVEIIEEVNDSIIISIGGNCGGKVKENIYDRFDARISGYAEIIYEEGD
jgi:hypothetical protein